MNQKQLENELNRALGLLATDPVAVLTERGIRGWRMSGCNCPAAKFLSAEIGRKVRVTAGYAAAETDAGILVRVGLPLRLSRTIREFDAGQHAALWDAPIPRKSITLGLSCFGAAQ